MSIVQIPGSALLVATLVIAMGLAAMSPLPASMPAKAPAATAVTVASR